MLQSQQSILSLNPNLALQKHPKKYADPTDRLEGQSQILRNQKEKHFLEGNTLHLREYHITPLCSTEMLNQHTTMFLTQNQIHCLTDKLTKTPKKYIKTYLWFWNKGLTWNYETVFNIAEMLRHDGQSATLLTSWISCKPLLKNQNM